MKQIVLGFGLLIAALLILFQLANLNHFNSGGNIEWWIAGFSILFFIIGIYLSRKLFRKEIITEREVILEKEIIVEVPVIAPVDPKRLEKSGISKREYEILLLINEGLSNQQIADQLFVSENTVKKHITSLFLKLDVQRRTEALKKAKSMRIIPGT